MYGSETWPMNSEDIQRLERTERMMIRWICGVKLSDWKASAELFSRLDTESVSDVVRRGRLRWFGHMEFKQPDDWVSACSGRGSPRKIWRECVEKEMVKLKLSVMDTHDR